MMRELRETPGERVVGFVDDNPQLRRRSVHGIKVLGTTHELDRVLARTTPDIVLVTIPDAPRETLDAIIEACEQAGVAVPVRPARGRPRPARVPRRSIRMTGR